MSKLFPFGRNNRNIVSPFNKIENFIDDTIGNLPGFNRNVLLDQFKIDVKEFDDKYLIEAELPGVEKDNIDLSLSDDGRLNISVSREESIDEKDEDDNYIHRERRYDSMQRSLYLADANPDGELSARLKDGLLIVTVEKESQDLHDNARKIEIE